MAKHLPTVGAESMLRGKDIKTVPQTKILRKNKEKRGRFWLEYERLCGQYGLADVNKEESV